MVNTDQQVLVIRFSSLGDVLLLIPVFRTLEKELPDFRFTLLTHRGWSSFFDTCPNVDVYGVDVKSIHSGFGGLWKIYKSLVKTKWHYIIDVHDVIRSRLLCQLLAWNGNTIHRYNKRRKLRTEILNGASTSRLPVISQQYLEAFHPLKPDMNLTEGPWLKPSIQNTSDSTIRIAIAPFSAHTAKEWPIEYWQQLIHEIALIDAELQLHCLAFSARELELYSMLKTNHPNLHLIDDHFTAPQQLDLMSQMAVVISVDSANMHLAALMAVPVISLWGTTMPELGFRPLDMETYLLEADAGLSRPRSVYGNVKSKKGVADAKAAMRSITVDQVMILVNKILG